MAKHSLSSYSTNRLQESTRLRIQEHRKDNKRKRPNFLCLQQLFCNIRPFLYSQMSLWDTRGVYVIPAYPKQLFASHLEAYAEKKKGVSQWWWKKGEPKTIHHLSIWWHYHQKQQGWCVSHHFRQYENAKCLFWGSVPTDVFSKTSLTKLLLLNSLQCRRTTGKNKKLLPNSGVLFQSNISKATVTLPLT